MKEEETKKEVEEQAKAESEKTQEAEAVQATPAEEVKTEETKAEPVAPTETKAEEKTEDTATKEDESETEDKATASVEEKIDNLSNNVNTFTASLDKMTQAITELIQAMKTPKTEDKLKAEVDTANAKYDGVGVQGSIANIPSTNNPDWIENFLKRK